MALFLGCSIKGRGIRDFLYYTFQEKTTLTYPSEIPYWSINVGYGLPEDCRPVNLASDGTIITIVR